MRLRVRWHRREITLPPPARTRDIPDPRSPEPHRTRRAIHGSKDLFLVDPHVLGDIIEQAAVHRAGQRHVKRVVAEMGGKDREIQPIDDAVANEIATLSIPQE